MHTTVLTTCGEVQRVVMDRDENPVAESAWWDTTLRRAIEGLRGASEIVAREER